MSEDHTAAHSAAERVPDEFPDTCTRCGTKAPAVDGRCPNPKCRCLRKGTQLAAKGGPVNVAKRDQLRARFLHDYRPLTTIDEVRVRELADIVERLSGLKKGSAEYQRLVQTMTALDEALRSSRAMQQRQQPSVTELTSDQLIAKLETLLAAVREAHLKPEPAVRQPAASESNLEPPRASNAAGPDLSPAPKTAASPTALCVYCNGLCVGKDRDIYRTLHALDPAEIDRKNAEATAEMLGLPADGPALPAPTDEQRRQAELRKQLGWDKGVLNEQTGYRHRE